MIKSERKKNKTIGFSRENEINIENYAKEHKWKFSFAVDVIVSEYFENNKQYKITQKEDNDFDPSKFSRIED